MTKPSDKAKDAADAELAAGTDVAQLSPEAQQLEHEFGEMEVAERRRTEFNVVNADDLSEDLLPDSWESALASLESIGAVVSRSDEDLADDFPVIDKERLINVEFLALTWSISMPNNETFGSPYIVVRGVRRDGRRFRFTDGSTGIAQQLIKLTERRIKAGFDIPNAGLHCTTGLRKSDYTYRDTDKDGNPIDVPATTFYINNEPAD